MAERLEDCGERRQRGAILQDEAHIDVSWAREVTMEVRWHSGTIATNAKVAVLAVPDGHTMDDPTAGFVDLTGSGSIEIDPTQGGAAAPYYKTYILGSGGSDVPMGAMVSLIVTGEQPTTPVDCEVVLSVDLVLRD